MRIILLVSLAVVGFVGLLPSTASSHGSSHTRVAPKTTHTDSLEPMSNRFSARSRRSVVAAAAKSKLRAPASCDPAGGSDRGAAASISLVYALPSGQANRFRRIAAFLQAAAVDIGRFVAAQSGGRKTVRFATGTSCGPRYLRVEFVQLARARSAYLDSNGVPSITPLRGDVERALPAASGPRNRLVYVDGMVARASGVGEVLDADQPGPTNPHNAGGRFAFVWGAHRAPSMNHLASYADFILHEITHTLGGVQRSAPHPSGAWHCTDGFDVMCYDDGSASRRQTTTCRGRSYDCNKDDYFNPSPAPGSYLASHWNVYDSAFLGGCRELREACGKSAG